MATIDEKAKTVRKVRPTGHIKKLQTKKFRKNMNRLCRKRPPYISIRMSIRLVKDPKIDKENNKTYVKFDYSPNLPYGVCYPSI